MTPVAAYKPDSWGPPEAYRIMASDDGWHNPVAEGATQ